MDSSLLNQEEYIIDNINNIYYNRNNFNYKIIFPREKVDDNYKHSLDYSSTSKMDIAIEKHNAYIPLENDTFNYIYDTLEHLLNKYTFGIEIETIQGIIPEFELNRLGLIPVRDGSISGIEYVTVPLIGKKGLYTYLEFIELINKYTDTNYTCSMHIHVGNIPRTEEFIVAMYKLANIFEIDLYKLFPEYKRINNGIKKQCYTSPLNKAVLSSLGSCTNSSEINKAFKKISFLLTGYNNSYNAEVNYSIGDLKSHPSDPNERSKWYMRERYKWLNLIPLIFTNKKTIEYRIFTVPNNIEKAILFLALTLNTVEFCVNNMKQINSGKIVNLLTMDLSDMLMHVSTSKNNYIYNLYNDRLNEVNNYKYSKSTFFEEENIITNFNIFQYIKL